jgi:hypothetical protein
VKYNCKEKALHKLANMSSAGWQNIQTRMLKQARVSFILRLKMAYRSEADNAKRSFVPKLGSFDAKNNFSYASLSGFWKI